MDQSWQPGEQASSGEVSPWEIPTQPVPYYGVYYAGAPLSLGDYGLRRQDPAAEQQLSSFGGLPSQGPFSSQFNPGEGLTGDPSNWFLSRADMESPLQYMHVGGGSMFNPGNPRTPGYGWAPNDRGGYFTLDQLFRAQSGRGDYQGVPIPFGLNGWSDMPSTNNWRLTVPYGGGPGAILRNGQVIYPGRAAAFGLPGTSVNGGGDVAESGVMSFNRASNPYAAITGNNVFGTSYWPGGTAFSGYMPAYTG